MKLFIMKRLLIVVALLYAIVGYTQGPPILTDKPIMLGEDKLTVRAMAMYRSNFFFDFYGVALMGDYNIKENIQVSARIPLVSGNPFPNDATSEVLNSIGDIRLQAKYQFYRKDGEFKTFRIAAKVAETFATGGDYDGPIFGLGDAQHYAGVVAGYESLKYGALAEFGYNSIPNSDEFHGFWVYKVAFGLPLKKPAYPANQVTLYFEYEGNFAPSYNHSGLLYAQGIQWAKGRGALEFSVQVPIYQETLLALEQDILIVLGYRYVF